MIAAFLGAVLLAAIPAQDETLLFHDPFDDTDWESHGWYDSPRMVITDEESVIPGGTSCVWRWDKAGDIGPVGRGARVRIPPAEEVTLSFHIKHSDNWEWTGVDWHPHEFHFITSEDDAFVGPACTHLTFYVEVVNGVPRIAVQDGRNIDEERLGEDLVGVTERRSVAGGNGDSDGYGNGTHYPSGSRHWNGKHWEPDDVYFGDEPGALYKGDWHHVKARLRLNSVADGIGQRDGVIQYWFDGALIMDYHDVVFRTGAHPGMKIDQFLMAPYFGPGVPHAQTIWIDDLTIRAGE
jgi:hypothetical protein